MIQLHRKCKPVEDLKNTSNHLNLIGIDRQQYQTIPDCTFFLHAYGMYTNIDDIQGHKSSFSKFPNCEILQSMLLVTMKLW